MRWLDFTREAPELAKLASDRFSGPEIVMMGTIRRDGWPRISPIEFMFFEDELMLGGMWRSRKFMDIERDSRCTLHSATSNKSGAQGDVKLYGRLVPLVPEQAERLWERLLETTGWRPTGPAHACSFDVLSGAFVKFDEDGTMHWLTWPGNEWRTKAST